uniref:Zinc ribbon domain-containing protein n=1 Tax=candidate division WWE3 bacterium TaxID=2053526 RepID=A0A7C4XN63_UNCKA
MMRYAAILCRDDSKKPFAIYVSFNRYYRLEPMLVSRANAITLFHSWVLARIILAAYETIADTNEFNQDDICRWLNYLNIKELEKLVGRLEKNLPLTTQEQDLANELTIYNTKNIIDNLLKISCRPRCILLLDDAALTLTPEYMGEFFDIFRTLKTAKISPKASVYPGTTEYGARFHPTQEGGFHSVWLSVEDSSYSDTMSTIASRRIENYTEIAEDVKEYLKFAAFGIPRAFLFMLKEYQMGGFKTPQQGLNRIIQAHIEARLEEFRSISLKSPKLRTLIEQGETLFSRIVIALKEFNDTQLEKGVKQLRVGISGIDEKPHVERMFNLLIEAGLLYEVPEKVSHGADRNYNRYVPHIAALLNQRAFSANERGWSPRIIVDKLNLKSGKQPLRRAISSLLNKDELDSLKFDLPPCSSCGTERVQQSQKFCHNCGSELIDSSTFESCISLPLHEVPGLTKWQTEKIKKELTKFKTIGDFLSTQDPGAELRRLHRIGQARAEKIINVITGFVDDFLQ